MNIYIFNDLNEFSEIETRLSLSKCLIVNHKYYLNYQGYRLRIPQLDYMEIKTSTEIRKRYYSRVKKLWRAENGYYLPRWCKQRIKDDSGRVLMDNTQKFYEYLQKKYDHLGYIFIYKKGPKVPFSGSEFF